jgi:hypothetical protein
LIREDKFETTDVSLTLQVTDAAGVHRELFLATEPAGVLVTVFHQTEHALIPVSNLQAREVARWLVERVGLPPGWEYRGGRLEHG